MIDDDNLIDWFRASTTYINAHRGKTFVVLITGEAIEHSNFHNIIYDLNLLHSLGVKLVLVHGARPQITESLQSKNLPCSYHDSVRVTEAQSIDEIIGTVGRLSTRIEALFSMGLANSPMDGAGLTICRGNFVTARPFGIHKGIDHHYTGRVRKIHHDDIQQQLDNNNIVLLSNLGYSLTGEVFNLTAEEVATETAVSLNAEKLILLTPTGGIETTSGDLVPSLSESDCENYISLLSQADDAESASLSKALSAAYHAYKQGVHRSHLISYKNNGAMLQELFTQEGRGSLISDDNFDRLRCATLGDVAGIISLIQPLENSGSLVVRSRELLENEIDNFQVVELEGSIIACAALYPLSSESAEVACIAINDQFRKRGYGQRLLSKLESLAREKSLQKLFVLTTVADHWFIEKGFSLSDIDKLPQSRKELYNFQRNSKVLLKLI